MGGGKIEKNLLLLTRVATVTISIVGIYLMLTYLLPLLGKTFTALVAYFSPFILAIVLAILIEPLIRILQRKAYLSRPLATFIAMVLLLGGINLLLFLLISRVVTELIQMSASLPNAQAMIFYFRNLINWATELYVNWNISPELMQTIEQNLGDLTLTLKEYLLAASNFLLALVASLPGFITILLVAIIATFFISRDRDKLIHNLLGLVNPQRGEQFRNITNDLVRALVGFLRAQALLISLTAIQTIIGLRLLGVEYAFTIGILVGIADLLPILGPGAIYVPWVLWHLLIGNWPFALKLVGLYATVLVVRQLLEPKIVAENIGLHPLAALIALYVGLKALGVAGIILGPAILIFIQALYKAGVISLGGKR